VGHSQTGITKSAKLGGAELTKMENLEEEAEAETIHVKFISSLLG
jgi:hypothetical protein